MSDILREIKNPIIGYKVGLISDAIVITVLNSAALLVTGVLYAILLGVFKLVVEYPSLYGSYH